MTDDQRRQRVLTYLYGGLTPAEEVQFRAQLETDAELARCLAQERRFDEVLPVGSGTELPDGALQESRLMLRGALRQRPALPADVRWRRWLAGLLPRAGWVAGAVALLAGVLLGRMTSVTPTQEAPLEALVDVRLRGVDEETGALNLELVGLTRRSVQGGLDDPSIQAVLTEAMLGDLEAEPRLLAVDLLRQRTDAADIRRALTQALLTDENPGVRLAAVEALGTLTQDGAVRRALQQVLTSDENAGVRVAAIEGLRQLEDNETRRVLQHVSQTETNEYIRAEARRAIKLRSDAPHQL